MPSLDGTLGASLIGGVVAIYLFGIQTMQTYNYYKRYTDDLARLKVLVGAVWVIELGHSIALWHALYEMTVTFYGQPAHLSDPPHSLEMTVLFSAIINLAVQTFFSVRIRTLSGHWYISIFCIFFTFVRFVFDMFMLAVFYESPGFEVFTNKVHWAMIGVSTMGPAVDVLIAGCLIFFLVRQRMESEFKRTRKVVDTLILWCVETTSITTAVGLGQLVCFLARRDLSWMVFFIVYPKLFSNSMLAHLNGRNYLRDRAVAVTTPDLNLTNTNVSFHLSLSRGGGAGTGASSGLFGFRRSRLSTMGGVRSTAAASDVEEGQRTRSEGTSSTLHKDGVDGAINDIPMLNKNGENSKESV